MSAVDPGRSYSQPPGIGFHLTTWARAPTGSSGPGAQAHSSWSSHPKLLAELTDVLHRPRFAQQAAAGRANAYVAALAADADRVDDPSDPPSVSPDADDDYLFALARAAGADLIVSGDRHLTTLPDPHPPVFTPREFVWALEEAEQGSTR